MISTYHLGIFSNFREKREYVKRKILREICYEKFEIREILLNVFIRASNA